MGLGRGMPCPCGGVFDVDFDFDFNILTAFIRLGRARPAGAGCPPYYYYLTLLVACGDYIMGWIIRRLAGGWKW